MRRKILFVTILSIALGVVAYMGYSETIKDEASAKCTGSKNCRACKNCKYCKHCNSGGTCGICR